MGATRLQHVISGDPAITEYVDPLSPGDDGTHHGQGRDSRCGVRPVPAVPAGAVHLARRRHPGVLRLRRRPLQPAADPACAAGRRRGPREHDVLRRRRRCATPTSSRTSVAPAHRRRTSRRSPRWRCRRPVAARRTRRPSCATACRTRRSSTTSTRCVARGSADGLTVVAKGAQGNENYTVRPESMVDPKFFTVKYDGPRGGRVRDLLRRDREPDGAWRGEPAAVRRHRVRPACVRRGDPVPRRRLPVHDRGDAWRARTAEGEGELLGPGSR